MISGGLGPLVYIAYLGGAALLALACDSEGDSSAQQNGGNGEGGAGGNAPTGGAGAGGAGGFAGGADAADLGTGGFGGTPVDQDLGAGGAGGQPRTDGGAGAGGDPDDGVLPDARPDMGPQIVDAMIRPDLGPPPECELSVEEDPDHDCVRSAEDNCPHIRNEDTQNNHRDFDHDGLDDICGDVDRAGVHDRFADFSDPQLLCEIRDINLASAEALDVLVRCQDGDGQVLRNALFSIPSASDVHFLAPQPDPNGEYEQISTKGPVRVSVINNEPELLQNNAAFFELDHILESGAQFVLLSANAHVLRNGTQLADLLQVTRPRREGEQGAISDIAFPSVGFRSPEGRVEVQANYVADVATRNGTSVFALNRSGDPVFSVLQKGAFFNEPFSLALNPNSFVDFSGDHDLRGLVWAAGAEPEIAALFAQSEAPMREGAIVRYLNTSGAVENQFTGFVSLGSSRLSGESHELFYSVDANGQFSVFDPATVNGAQEPVLMFTDQRLANAREIALRRSEAGVIYGAASVPAQNADGELGKVVLFEMAADAEPNVRVVEVGWNPGSLEIDENLNVYVAVEENVWQREPGQLNGGAARLVALRWVLRDVE